MTADATLRTQKIINNLQPNPDAHFVMGPWAPVEICQIQEEFGRVLALYTIKKPARVLEIGTASGGTLYHWLQNAAPDATVVTVDLVEPHYESSEHLYPEWTPDGVTCIQVRGSSHDPEVLEQCRAHAPYEWLFIDGAHTYQDAKMDWNDYKPLCDHGAYVFLHDIALLRRYQDGTTAGVHQLWREIQAEGYWTCEIRAKPLVHAYSIGVVVIP